jgi:hypothetical protein
MARADEHQPIIPTMHLVDPAELSAAQARLVWRHLSRVAECTPAGLLADLFGQPRGRYHLSCPSDRTYPGIDYAMRVRWTDRGVWAGHYGRLCPAAELGKICWHAYAVVLRIALMFYGGEVPVAAPADPSPGVPAASPEPPRAAEPEPRAASIGPSWYD